MPSISLQKTFPYRIRRLASQSPANNVTICVTDSAISITNIVRLLWKTFNPCTVNSGAFVLNHQAKGRNERNCVRLLASSHRANATRTTNSQKPFANIPETPPNVTRFTLISDNLLTYNMCAVSTADMVEARLPSVVPDARSVPRGRKGTPPKGAGKPRSACLGRRRTSCGLSLMRRATMACGFASRGAGHGQP